MQEWVDSRFRANDSHAGLKNTRAIVLPFDPGSRLCTGNRRILGREFYGICWRALMSSREELRRKGNEIRERLQHGSYPSRRPRAVASVPGLRNYTGESIFGSVWARPGLDIRYRMLATLSVLSSLQRPVAAADIRPQRTDPGPERRGDPGGADPLQPLRRVPVNGQLP